MIKRLARRVLSKTLGWEVYKATDPRLSQYTITAQTTRRLVHFGELLTQVEDLDGDVVECGIGRGNTLFALSVLVSLSDKERHIYGFDSFQGLPEPSEEDGADVSAPLLKSGSFAFSKDYVLQRLSKSGLSAHFIDNRITLVAGYFSETLVKYDGAGIALLYLDVDLYQSYKEALEHFYPKVRKGGIITFDEYRDPLWLGATRAIDEFFEGRETITKSRIFNNRMRAPRSTRYADPTSYDGGPEDNSRYWENEKALYYVVKQ